MAEFTATFDVEGATRGLYNNFIGHLRDRLEDGRTQNRQRLLCPQPPEGVQPTRFFDVVFTTTVRSVRVRFRSDNLYVVGFTRNRDGRGGWFEYKRKAGEPRLIPGSQFLSLTHTYGSLETFRIGRQELAGVVNSLGITTEDRERVHGMTMIALMVSEPVRLERVFTHVSAMFAEVAQGGFLTVLMRELIRFWDPSSAAIIRANQDGSDFTIPQPNNVNIVTFENATREIGMVLRVCTNRNAQVRYIRDTSNNLTGGGDICPAGRPLVEVFKITVADAFGSTYGNYYGTIMASDGLASQYLYNVDSDHAQHILDGHMFSLSGPSRPMWALGNFSIDVALWNRDTGFPIQCQVAWDAYNNVTNVYDKPLHDRVHDGNMFIGIHYAIFRDAVQATIRVKLMGGEETSKIYGSIGAINSTVQGQSPLFDRYSGNYQQVELFDKIPLQRRVVAVPLAARLEIRANLWHHNFIFFDEEIASGSAVFQAKLAGTEEQVITGKQGKIQVRVTWS